MPNLKTKKNRIKKLLLWIVIFWSGIVFFLLYFGVSFFFTTTYAYVLIALLFYYLFNKFQVSSNSSLMVYSILISLFAGEVTLRYVIKYPLSYSEQNGGGYTMVDRYALKNNLHFKYIDKREDVYTLEFDSGEIRDNNCFDYQYANDTCNALGFRGRLPSENKKIILVLGDSFTEGAGAPADSSCPALLRKYITAKDSSLDVLNAGISGNDIFFDWKMVQKLESKYTLKQIIFLMNTTDINDIAVRGGNNRFCTNGLLKNNSQPWWEPVYAVSFVFRLFVHNVFNRDFNLFSSEELIKRNNIAIEKIAKLIQNEIIPWSKRAGVNALFVVHPLDYELKKTNLEYVQLLNALRQIDSTNVVDCLPALKSQGNAAELYWKNDRHFKPIGYSIITNKIIENRKW